MKKIINFNNSNKEHISENSVQENSDIDINSKNTSEIVKKEKINSEDYIKNQEKYEEFEKYYSRKEIKNAEGILLDNNINEDNIYRSEELRIFENKVNQQKELNVLELSGSEKNENERELETINKIEKNGKIRNLN